MSVAEYLNGPGIVLQKGRFGAPWTLRSREQACTAPVQTCDGRAGLRSYPAQGKVRRNLDLARILDCSGRCYWAAAAMVRAPANGRYARRNVRICRTARGILSGVSFHG